MGPKIKGMFNREFQEVLYVEDGDEKSRDTPSSPRLMGGFQREKTGGRPAGGRARDVQD